jgi:hypothetical protein
LYELAILATARELDQQFEWSAHEPAARGDDMAKAAALAGDQAKAKRYYEKLLALAKTPTATALG